jgi:hypothetical protein
VPALFWAYRQTRESRRVRRTCTIFDLTCEINCAKFDAEILDRLDKDRADRIISWVPVSQEPMCPRIS